LPRFTLDNIVGELTRVCNGPASKIGAQLRRIEKATLRLVALRVSANTSIAAARLGMAPVSLFRWMERRAMPTV
jgi:hypothetical protein